MKYRILGKTGCKVSEVSSGTWQLGARWGDKFNEDEARATLHAAIEKGINFIDTADVYSEGLSERAIGRFLREVRGAGIFVATKCGRKLKPHVADAYNERNIRGFVEASLKNMGVDVIDLIQLHCPPTDVYYRPEVFETLDKLRKEGKIRFYGVSVEKVEEGLKALEYQDLATVQIIFNIFRQRPSESFFREAKKRDVGIIVRVPLASGLLTGKFSKNTLFGKGDHRLFNREGKFFDKGETFSGVRYDAGLEAVEELKRIFGTESIALPALRWVLMFSEVSCVIPGASSSKQAEENAKASDLPKLTGKQMRRIKKLYEDKIKPDVHQRW